MGLGSSCLLEAVGRAGCADGVFTFVVVNLFWFIAELDMGTNEPGEGLPP